MTTKTQPPITSATIQKKILIIDDKQDIRLSARFLLSNHGFDLVEADSPGKGLELLYQQNIDLILLDMNYSLDTTCGDEGLSCLQKIRAMANFVPVIVITAWSNTELVVKAMNLGAQDFIEKPWDNQRLIQVVNQALAITELQQQNQKLKQQVADQQVNIQLVVKSKVMRELLRQLEAVAKTNANVLLTGQNGCGKSSLAKYIHQTSPNSQAPLISVNMGAIVDNLFESEMFGHVKGAFTGAFEHRIGRFELANGSTLFLDEVANIPLSQQAKLLKVLESGEYEAVGSSKTRIASSRLISATNGNFAQLIQAGQFRQDLYFRLNTVELKVPSLKERSEDIADLAQQFLAQHCTRYQKPSLQLTKDALQALQHYDFPGNLRELSHILERAVIMKVVSSTADQWIDAQALGELTGALKTSVMALSVANNDEPIKLMTIECAERQLIDAALKQTAGQTIEAAQILGISKSALYRRLEKYQISAKHYLDSQSSTGDGSR